MLKEVNTLKDFKQTVGLITIAFKKKKREHLSSFFFFLIAHLFIFGCAGSSLLHWLFSSCGEWVCSLVVALRLLIAVASLAAEHRL